MPKTVHAVIPAHPVAPTKELLDSIKQPVLITWAMDDRWGQPFFGPHGASWFVKHLGCDLLSWKESNFGDRYEFYREIYPERVVDFVKQNPFKLFKPAFQAKSKIIEISRESSQASKKGENQAGKGTYIVATQ